MFREEKRLVSMLLCIALLLTMLPASVFAQEAPVTFRMEASAQDVAVGDTIEFTVSVSNVHTPAMEFRLDIPEGLRFVESSGVSLAKSALGQNEAGKGWTGGMDWTEDSMMWTAYNDFAMTFSEGTVLLTFSCVAEAEGSYEFGPVDMVVFDADYGQPETAAVLASVSVTAPAGEPTIPDRPSSDDEPEEPTIPERPSSKDEPDACAHDYTSEITVTPTCTEDGMVTYTCAQCGDSYTEALAAYGHEYDSATCIRCGFHNEAPVGYYFWGIVRASRTQAQVGDVIEFTVYGDGGGISELGFELSIPQGLRYIPGSAVCPDSLTALPGWSSAAWNEDTMQWTCDPNGYSELNYNTVLLTFSCEVEAPGTYDVGLTNAFGSSTPFDEFSIITVDETVTVTDTPESGSDYTRIYCKTAASWTACKVYWWGSADTPDTTWPGADMAKDSNGIWTIEVPSDAVGLIFNNGAGSQTADLTVPTDSNVMYTCSTASWGPYNTTAVETAYYVTGSFNSWINPDPAYKMVKQADGTYTLTIPLAAGNHELKVTNGTWDMNWGSGTGNYKFTAASAGEYIVTFDGVGTVNVIGDPGEAEPMVIDFITVVGEKALTGIDWDPTDESTMMDQNGKVYTLTLNNVDAGEHEFKFAANGGWDIHWASGDLMVPGESYTAWFTPLSNSKLNITSQGSTVTLTLDLTNMDYVTGEGAVCSVAIEESTPIDPPSSDAEIVDAAYALAEGESMAEAATLTGVITSIDTPYSSTYKNITVTIAVAGREDKPILCYRLKGEGADTLAVGDTITVTGILTNYMGTIEFKQGCTLDAVVSGGATVVVPSDPCQIVDAAYALEPGAILPYEATLTGSVIEITEAYSETYKNMSVSMFVPGREDKPILCYRLKVSDPEMVADLAVGDTITVTGNLKNYTKTDDAGVTTSTIEFTPCTLIEVIKGEIEAPFDGVTLRVEASDKEVDVGDTIDFTVSVSEVYSPAIEFMLDIPEGLRFVSGSGIALAKSELGQNDAGKGWTGGMDWTEELMMWTAYNDCAMTFPEGTVLLTFSCVAVAEGTYRINLQDAYVYEGEDFSEPYVAVVSDSVYAYNPSNPDHPATPDEPTAPADPATCYHSFYGPWVTIKEPTCTTNGYQVRSCSYCGLPAEGTWTEALPSCTGEEYLNSMNKTFPTFRVPGASKLVLHFSADSYLEDNYDKLYIYSGSSTNLNNLVGTYTGSLANKTVTVYSNSFTVAMVTDSVVTTYGFEIEAVDYYCSSSTKTLYSLGHNLEVLQVVSPTCEAEGYTEYICHCGYTYRDSTTSRLPHNYGEGVTVPPSCISSGYILYTCNDCGTTMKEYTSSPPGAHRFDEGVVTPATCTEAGCITYTCAVCNATKTIQTDEALGHLYQDHICLHCGLPDHMPEEPFFWTTVKASKTEAAVGDVIDYVVYGCGNPIVAFEFCLSLPEGLRYVPGSGCCPPDLKDHLGWAIAEWSEDSMMWTGYNDLPATFGWNTVLMTFSCVVEKPGSYDVVLNDSFAWDANFEYVYPSISIDRVTAACSDDTHSWLAATCQAPETCEYCGLTRGQIGEHRYETSVIAPTCETEGYTDHVCPLCGDSYRTDSTQPLGHNESVSVLKPTCTETGSNIYTCSRCGNQRFEEIPATGHSYQTSLVEPTCTQQGYYRNDCSQCGNWYVLNWISATGHSYESVVTAPTCTEEGFTTHTCHCGDSYVDSYTTPLGHEEQCVTLEATCTTAGSNTYTCTRCNNERTVPIPATGHSYVTTVVEATCTEDGYRRNDCSKCDSFFYLSMTPATGHSYEAVVTPPTATEGGYTTHTCHCGDSYVTDPTPALGVTLTGSFVTFLDGLVTLELMQDGKVIYTFTASGITGSYELPGVLPGSYTLRVSKSLHVPREYDITVDTNAAPMDVKIHKPGDVNGDGKITVLDVSKIYSHTKKFSMLSGYEFQVADVNNDNKNTVADVSKLYAHTKKTSILW